jgi:hypothetical protein
MLCAIDCLAPTLPLPSLPWKKPLEDHGSPPSSPCSWQIGNQPLLIGDLLDVTWHLTDVYHEPINHNHPCQGVLLHFAWAVPLRVHLPHPEGITDGFRFRGAG